ncbi:MAG: magnesium/cobalt transporter CorA [Methanobacteriota archaeon]
MSRFIKKGSQNIGLIPGELIHIGQRKTEKTRITVIDYDAGTLKEKEIKKVEECFPFKEKPTVTWINVDGIHQVDIIEKIGTHFGLHPLILEDILNTEQRPKMEDFENYIFVVLKMLYYNEKDQEVCAEQVSIILGSNFVLSFQEQEGDVFNHIRERIRNNKGRIRKMASDYLAYSLIDAIVDNYFIILEKIGEKIEEMEDTVVSHPTPEILQTIHTLKGEMIFIRKSIWPLREVISGLQRAESNLIHDTTAIYLRDVYDHTIQVIDTVETFRDTIAGLLDIYISSVSNKMNEVMKVLTIFAAIFIPLTFVAGLYGMNFNPEKSPVNMPELNWFFGYPFALSIMLIISIIMLIYFRRKKWL